MNRSIVTTIVFLLIFAGLVVLAVNNFTPRTLVNSLTPISYTNLNNELYGFGSNFAGQLGIQNLLKSPIEIQSLGAENIIKFDAGNKHTVVLTASGEVIQYGLNGVVNESNQRYIEISDGVNLANIIDVQAGADYSLALKEDGTVWAWGKNLTAQLGQGNNDESLYALKINELSNITQISAGYKFGLALDQFGELWGWGGSCNESRKNAAAEWLSSPQTIPGIGGYYDPTSLGGGDNLNNQSEDYNSYCANEEVIGFSSKTPIKLQGFPLLTKVSAGWGHTLGIDENGDVWGLGCNLYKQISNTPDHMKPNKIAGLSNIAEVSAGYRHSLALNKNGEVSSWGYNLRGDLGLGTNSELEDMPQRVNLKNIMSIVAGHDFSTVLNNKGELIIFGENNSGVISKDLNLLYNSTPKVIHPGKTFDSVTTGKNFVVALVNK